MGITMGVVIKGVKGEFYISVLSQNHETFPKMLQNSTLLEEYHCALIEI